MNAPADLIGARVERVEDLRLLTGRGNYVDDIHLDGMLHAAIVRSTVAHGELKSIDVEAAKGMPGVRAVYTGRDIAAEFNPLPKVPIRLAPIPELHPFRQYVIALDRVRYVGEPLAIVIAETPAQAEDAADQIYADIESLPVVADWRQAAQCDSLLFESHGSNAAMTYTANKGDAKNATGPYIRREKFGVQRHSAITMETRGLLAQWDAAANKMTVFGAAKVPFFTRDELAKAMGLPTSGVDMIEVEVGGGFGVRGEFYPEDFLVPYAARKLGIPVKWIEDRRENLLSANHSREMDCEIEIVCERNGRIVALRGTVAVDIGAYMRSSGAVPPRNVAQFMSGPYDVPNIHIESTAYLTNKAPIGTYRGPGRFEGDFFRERMFDMAARDLGIDPIEFRRINLVKEEQMPFPLADLNHPDRFEELDTGDYRITLEHCLKEIQWEAKRELQGRLIDGKYHGLALSCFIEGGAAGVKETARLIVEKDGRITLHTGSANVGQGLVTILTQIAAQTLDVPMNIIRVLHGSTDHLKEGFGSFHSRSTVMGGSAVLTTALALRERVKEVAAAQWGCAAGEVQLEAGLTARFKDQSLTLAQLGELGTRVDGEFPSHVHTYSYGAAAAHVAVDPGTGKVDVIDYFVVEDVGRIINPLTAHGQLVGAVAQGLGGAFLEHLAYDENGQFLAGTLADYLLPTASDFPCIRAAVLGNSPSPDNPLGAKGIGEGGIVSVGGVIANAVSAALVSLGVEVRTLPITPPKIWAMINGGRD